MVIDTVTSSPSSSVIAAYRAQIQKGANMWCVCVCVGGGGRRRSEHYHGRFNGCKLRGRRTCTLMWLIPLCVMSMIGGGDRRGLARVSIPLWTNKRSCQRDGKRRGGIQRTHHTCRARERERAKGNREGERRRRMEF